MALNAKTAGNDQQENRVTQSPIEPGVYPGRLVQLIDLGLQAQRAFQGKDKPPAQEIMLTYELVDEFMKDEDGNDIEDKPRWVSETMPFHNLKADKAKSTKRYEAFDPKGEFDGDFSKAVGLPINITVVHNVVGEKTYVNVANIAAMRPRDAEKCPELKNEAKVFDLSAPSLELFNSFPDWIKEKIKKNLNFQGSELEALLSGKPQEKKEEKKPDPDDHPFKDEDESSENPY